MAAIRCSPRACCGKRLIVVGLVMCSSSYTCLPVMDSRFNGCWYTLHVSYSASCLDENRGKVHVSIIRTFPRFVKRRGNIRLWEVLRLHACSPLDEAAEVIILSTLIQHYCSVAPGSTIVGNGPIPEICAALGISRATL